MSIPEMAGAGLAGFGALWVAVKLFFWAVDLDEIFPSIEDIE